MVTLPMTKAVFIANEDKYIASVATAAGVNQENVKILNIDEVTTRNSKMVSARLLLATSVHVQTSVLTAIGQPTNIRDQSVLNSNLIRNGLPSGTLVVQYTYVFVVNVTTSATGPASGVVNVTTSATGPASGSAGAETSSVNVTSPAALSGVSPAEVASTASSNVPMGAIVGGAVGFSGLVAVIFLALRLKKYYVG